MQTNDYNEKYKNFFKCNELDKVVANVLNVPNYRCTNVKYATIESNQVDNRCANFRNAWNGANSQNSFNPLQPICEDLRQIYARNSDAAVRISKAYFNIIFLNLTYNSTQDDIILAFIQSVSDLPKLQCIDYIARLFNAYDDNGLYDPAEKFYKYGEMIAANHPWIRFREFRTSLECKTNSEFTKLNKQEYRINGKGKDIYEFAGNTLSTKEICDLFDAQSASYNARIAGEKAKLKAAEDARIAKEKKDEEARKAKEARQLARSIRAKNGAQWFFFLVPAVVLILGMIIALVKPTLIFGLMHYGWVIGIYIAVPIIMCIISVVCYNNCGVLYYEGKRLALVIVINIISLVFMIIRLASIPSSTIEINTINDFDCLSKGYMPTANCYRLSRDLDFEGRDIQPIKELPSGSTFDGNGHIISNFKISTIVDVTEKTESASSYYMYSIGLFAICEGTIENLTLKNISITVDQEAFHKPYTIGWGETKYPDRLCVGNIAGVNFGGIIKNCKVIGFENDLNNAVNFNIQNEIYGQYGICGWNFSYKKGVIENCYAVDSDEIEIGKDEYGKTYWKIDGICYDLNNGEATVVSQKNIDGNVKIPTDITLNSATYIVSGIDSYAFKGCSGITGIEIPNSVVRIGFKAFDGCSNIKSIEIPNSVTHISDSIFCGCSGLERVTLPFVGLQEDMENSNYVVPFGCIFGNERYDGGVQTEQVYISNFEGGINKSTYYIPASLKYVKLTGGSIYWGSFSGCSGLKSIELPNGLRYVDDCAFSGCKGLVNIKIPGSVVSLGSQAFDDCSSLVQVSIPTGVSSVGEYAFRGCDALTIYCAVSSKPSGWDSNWNYSNCPVIWNSNI